MEPVPLVPENGGVGNTRTPPSKHWFFTLNNPEEADIDVWRLAVPTNILSKFVVQLERGKEGTIHLQGNVCFNKKVRPKGIAPFNDKYHWEKTKNSKAAYEYCQKDDTRIEGPWIYGIDIKDDFILPELREWQKELWDILNVKADDRTIHWWYDKIGGMGKTTLAKHIVTSERFKDKALYLSGKASDCKYAVSLHIEKKKKLDVVIFDFTRSTENYVSYEAIESIKNGIFFNTKYESGMCVYPSPHIICLSNFEPDIHKLSADRWRIRDIHPVVANNNNNVDLAGI